MRPIGLGVKCRLPTKSRAITFFGCGNARNQHHRASGLHQAVDDQGRCAWCRRGLGRRNPRSRRSRSCSHQTYGGSAASAKGRHRARSAIPRSSGNSGHRQRLGQGHRNREHDCTGDHQPAPRTLFDDNPQALGRPRTARRRACAWVEGRRCTPDTKPGGGGGHPDTPAAVQALRRAARVAEPQVAVPAGAPPQQALGFARLPAWRRPRANKTKIPMALIRQSATSPWQLF